MLMILKNLLLIIKTQKLKLKNTNWQQFLLILGWALLNGRKTSDICPNSRLCGHYFIEKTLSAALKIYEHF